jgi:hypothetical protein
MGSIVFSAFQLNRVPASLASIGKKITSVAQSSPNDLGIASKLVDARGSAGCCLYRLFLAWMIEKQCKDWSRYGWRSRNRHARCLPARTLMQLSAAILMRASFPRGCRR